METKQTIVKKCKEVIFQVSDTPKKIILFYLHWPVLCPMSVRQLHYY